MEINDLRYLVVKITGKDKKGDRKQALPILKVK